MASSRAEREERDGGIAWSALGAVLGTAGIAAGVGLGIGYLGAAVGGSFDGTMFLVGVLGLLCVFAYLAVLDSVGTARRGMGTGHLGGTPAPEGTVDGDGNGFQVGLSASHLVLPAGIGLLVAAVVGIAVL